MTLIAADSSTPQPAKYPGHDLWAVYAAGDTPHIWTREEVAAVPVADILPIVVPPQSSEWWLANDGYSTLEELVREAIAWGSLGQDSPVCLDMEEAQVEAIGPKAGGVAHAWQIACAAHGLDNWSYGSRLWHATNFWGKKWLAEWPSPTPENPEVPVGFDAWQYAGNVDGIDLDVFNEGHRFLSPGLTLNPPPVVETPITTEAAPVVNPTPATSPDTAQPTGIATPGDATTTAPPAPAEAKVDEAAQDEVPAVESAISAQEHTVAVDTHADKFAAARAVVDKIDTHVAELRDLLKESL